MDNKTHYLEFSIKNTENGNNDRKVLLFIKNEVYKRISVNNSLKLMVTQTYVSVGPLRKK